MAPMSDGHLVDGQDPSAGPLVADDVRDGGLLRGAEQARSRRRPRRRRPGTSAARGVKPMAAVAEPVTSRPGEHHRLAAQAVRQPAGKRQRRGVAGGEHGQRQPAASGPAPSAATANSGTVAMRTPKVAQPLAKLENSAAR